MGHALLLITAIMAAVLLATFVLFLVGLVLLFRRFSTYHKTPKNERDGLDDFRFVMPSLLILPFLASALFIFTNGQDFFNVAF